MIASPFFFFLQNGKGGEDHFVVVHGFDPDEDKKKPWHLRGPFILSSYETNLIKVRRVYDRYVVRTTRCFKSPGKISWMG